MLSTWGLARIGILRLAFKYIHSWLLSHAEYIYQKQKLMLEHFQSNYIDTCQLNS